MNVKVGNRYRSVYQTGPYPTYTCVAVCGEKAWLQRDDKGHFITCDFSNLVEVKEPQTIKAYVNVYRDHEGKLWYGNVQDSPNASLLERRKKDFVKTIEVSYTEEV